MYRFKEQNTSKICLRYYGFVCNNEMILKHVIFLNGVRMYICRDDSTSVKTILINVQVTNVTISKTHVKMFINDTFIFFIN